MLYLPFVCAHVEETSIATVNNGNAGTIVGAVIGSILGLALIAAIVVLVLYFYRYLPWSLWNLTSRLISLTAPQNVIISYFAYM